jgi:hypothetical protein
MILAAIELPATETKTTEAEAPIEEEPDLAKAC